MLSGCTSQLGMPDKIMASDYFYLDFKPGTRFISFSWKIKKPASNKVGQFILDHERFIYIFNNRSNETTTKVFESEPDLLKLKKVFDFNINRDSIFNHSLTNLLRPICGNSSRDTFSLNELMMVASRFFYCEAISPNYGIGNHMACVGFNGQSESHWKKDYTALEAFCFECLMRKYGTTSYRNIEDFFYQAISNNISFSRWSNTKVNNYLLLLIRNDVYERMQGCQLLKSLLCSYYKENEGNLSFVIM